MDAKDWAAIVAPLYKAIGHVVEDFSRQPIADIDIELIRLERGKLAEALEDTKVAVIRAFDLEKKNKYADLASRGLSSSSLKLTTDNSVDALATDVLDKMHREYNRAIEKLALLEKR